MPTRYHVAPSTWTDGDDLLSLDEQINRGILTEDEARAAWKWEHDFEAAPDRQFVSLWETIAEAREWQAREASEGRPGGVILRVETETWQDMWHEPERHWAALVGVKGDNVSLVEDWETDEDA